MLGHLGMNAWALGDDGNGEHKFGILVWPTIFLSSCEFLLSAVEDREYLLFYFLFHASSKQ